MTATVYLSDGIAILAAICTTLMLASVILVIALLVHSVWVDRQERNRRPGYITDRDSDWTWR